MILPTPEAPLALRQDLQDLQDMVRDSDAREKCASGSAGGLGQALALESDLRAQVPAAARRHQDPWGIWPGFTCRSIPFQTIEKLSQGTIETAGHIGQEGNQRRPHRRGIDGAQHPVAPHALVAAQRCQGARR